MTTALFDEPPRITFNQPSVAGGSRNGLLLGLDIGSEVLGIVCLEDGRLSLVHGSYFSIDYRYDVETDRWVDQNERKADQEG